MQVHLLTTTGIPPGEMSGASSTEPSSAEAFLAELQLVMSTARADASVNVGRNRADDGVGSDSPLPEPAEEQELPEFDLPAMLTKSERSDDPQVALSGPRLTTGDPTLSEAESGAAPVRGTGNDEQPWSSKADGLTETPAEPETRSTDHAPATTLLEYDRSAAGQPRAQAVAKINKHHSATSHARIQHVSQSQIMPVSVITGGDLAITEAPASVRDTAPVPAEMPDTPALTNVARSATYRAQSWQTVAALPETDPSPEPATRTNHPSPVAFHEFTGGAAAEESVSRGMIPTTKAQTNQPNPPLAAGKMGSELPLTEPPKETSSQSKAPAPSPEKIDPLGASDTDAPHKADVEKIGQQARGFEGAVSVENDRNGSPATLSFAPPTSGSSPITPATTATTAAQALEITGNLTASASRTSALPPDPAPVAQQIAMAVRNHAAGVTEIRLDPPELGVLRLDLRTNGAVASLTIGAERPEALDLVRSGLHGLTSELRALGFERVEVALGPMDRDSDLRADPGHAGWTGHDAQPPREDAYSATYSPDEAPDSAHISATLVPQSDAALDIRL